MILFEFLEVETTGRLAQERLSAQLDSVEVEIARQVAQRSHSFFQVGLVSREFFFVTSQLFIFVVKT